MKVSALYRYPVKSLGGNSLPEIELGKRGFVDDRRWMFATAEGKFITQRENPQLAKYRAEVTGRNELVITNIGSGKVTAVISGARTQGQCPPGPQGGGLKVPTEVWGTGFAATRVDRPAIDGLCSSLYLPDAQLLYMSEDDSRPVDPDYAKPEDEVSFADGFPYLIVGTASLRSLSEKLGQPVDMLRFRPNIVIETEEPFIEDTWKEIRIGDQLFELPKPCARCIMVTQEPGTGLRDLSVLSTLATYRKAGRKTLFGMNAIWRGERGVLRVRDSVEVSKH